VTKADDKGGYLLVGVVGRARGLKGHVRVRPFTDDPARFLGLESAWVEENGRYSLVGIAEADVNGADVWLRFEGCEDRTAAEKLNGRELFVSREDAVKLPPGAHFIADIVGCAVEDGEGHFLGRVSDVLQSGAADVYMLSGGPGGEVMFPALKSVILSTDTAGKKIMVDSKRFREVSVFED
jgi:16S rRNA processing protein RimM